MIIRGSFIFADRMSSSEYVCTLDEAALKKAAAELNENPRDRMEAVNVFRTWIEQQPHIKAPTGDYRKLFYCISNLANLTQTTLKMRVSTLDVRI